MRDKSFSPTVSVIIPVYNREETIGGTLRSVFEQTFSDYEVICVDDGSTDRSAEVIERYSDRVNYVRQENRGIAAARNAGIKLSKGKYIAFLDADDLWDHEKLHEQVKYLDANPDVAMVHSNARIARGNTVVCDRLDIKGKHKKNNIYEELYLGNFINTLTVMLRRSALEASGVFDEQFINSQDYDLWLRIAALSNVGFQDVVLGTYMLHGGNISSNRMRVLKDQIGIMSKHQQLHPELIRNIPRRKITKRFYEKYYSLGYGYFCRHDMRNSRKYFRKAMGYKRFAVRPYLYLLASYCGDNFIGNVRQLKSLFRKPRENNQTHFQA